MGRQLEAAPAAPARLDLLNCLEAVLQAYDDGGGLQPEHLRALASSVQHVLQEEPQAGAAAADEAEEEVARARQRASAALAELEQLREELRDAHSTRDRLHAELEEARTTLEAAARVITKLKDKSQQNASMVEGLEAHVQWCMCGLDDAAAAAAPQRSPSLDAVHAQLRQWLEQMQASLHAASGKPDAPGRHTPQQQREEAQAHQGGAGAARTCQRRLRWDGSAASPPSQHGGARSPGVSGGRQGHTAALYTEIMDTREAKEQLQQQVDVLSAELAAVKQQAHAHADAQQARLDEARQRLEDSSALLGEEVSSWRSAAAQAASVAEAAKARAEQMGAELAHALTCVRAHEASTRQLTAEATSAKLALEQVYGVLEARNARLEQLEARVLLPLLAWYAHTGHARAQQLRTLSAGARPGVHSKMGGRLALPEPVPLQPLPPRSQEFEALRSHAGQVLGSAACAVDSAAERRLDVAQAATQLLTGRLSDLEASVQQARDKVESQLAVALQRYQRMEGSLRQAHAEEVGRLTMEAQAQASACAEAQQRLSAAHAATAASELREAQLCAEVDALRTELQRRSSAAEAQAQDFASQLRGAAEERHSLSLAVAHAKREAASAREALVAQEASAAVALEECMRANGQKLASSIAEQRAAHRAELDKEQLRAAARLQDREREMQSCFAAKLGAAQSQLHDAEQHSHHVQARLQQEAGALAAELADVQQRVRALEAEAEDREARITQLTQERDDAAARLASAVSSHNARLASLGAAQHALSVQLQQRSIDEGDMSRLRHECFQLATERNQLAAHERELQEALSQQCTRTLAAEEARALAHAQLEQERSAARRQLAEVLDQHRVQLAQAEACRAQQQRDLEAKLEVLKARQQQLRASLGAR